VPDALSTTSINFGSIVTQSAVHKNIPLLNMQSWLDKQQATSAMFYIISIWLSIYPGAYKNLNAAFSFLFLTTFSFFIFTCRPFLKLYYSF